MINDIHVDLCFIGTDGFSNMTGPSTPSSSDAFLDRTIISHSDKNISSVITPSLSAAVCLRSATGRRSPPL